MKSRSSFVIRCWMAVALLCGLSPLRAMADCQAWLLLDKFNVVQENGYTVLFERVADRWRASYRTENFGLVEGDPLVSFDGKVLNIQVTWQDDTLGQYDGYVESSGSLAGLTRNLSVPGSAEVRWRSSQNFQCAPEAEKSTKAPVVEPEQSGVVDRPRDFDVRLPEAQATGLAGIWDTVTSSGGHFTLTLNKDGKSVTGSLGHAEARFDGTLVGTLNEAGNELAFTFSQPQLGVTGQGTFFLVAKDSIDGRFTVNQGPGSVFLWTGTRRP